MKWPAPVRLAALQARWHLRPLLGATFSLALAQLVVQLTLSLGFGLDAFANAWLGANRPLDTAVVVPRRLTVGGLSFADTALGGGAPLTEAVARDLAALPGVRAAAPVGDLPLPMVAEGGEALFGRALRADVVAVGLPESAQASFADDPCGPIPVLLHPRLLALYNAAIAPALHLPQLDAQILTGLQFTVRVGPSHLPGRAPVRKAGGFVAQVVGFSSAAEPMALSIPWQSAARLWGTYAAEPEAPLPVARVRLQLCSPQDAARVVKRVEKLGFEVDDEATALRGGVDLARRVAACLGLLIGALCAGYGLQALAAHVAGAVARHRVLWRMGQPDATLAAAACLQGLGVGAVSALVALAALRPTAAALQHALAAAAAKIPFALPPLWIVRLGPAAACAASSCAAVALGSWLAQRRSARSWRLDKTTDAD